VRPLRLNLRHLEGALELRRTHHFGAAARAISLSQSALTQGIAALERHLGCALFERRPDGTFPTPAGAIFTDAVARALDGLNCVTLNQANETQRVPLSRRVTLTQLRALLAVDAARSIRGAARASGLSEASIHRALSDLQSGVRILLAIPERSGVTLTAAGLKLAQAARVTIGELESGLATARAGQPQPIRVGAMPLIRAGLLPSAIAQLCAARPDVHVEVIEGAYSQLLDALLAGKLDLLLGALRETAPDGTIQRHLFDDELVMVARSDHPLATATQWDPASIATYPWAASPRGTPRRALWEAMLRQRGVIPPVPRLECSSASAVRSLLLHGHWLAMLSPDQFRIERELGLLSAIGGPFATTTRPIGVTMRAIWRPDADQRALLDILDRCVRSSIGMSGAAEGIAEKRGTPGLCAR